MPSLFKGQFFLEKGGFLVYLSVREKQRFQPSSKHSNSTHSTSGLSGECSTPFRQPKQLRKAVWGGEAFIWIAVHIPLFFVMLSFDTEGKMHICLNNTNPTLTLENLKEHWYCPCATTQRMGFLHLRWRKGRGMFELSPVCGRKQDVVGKLPG